MQTPHRLITVDGHGTYGGNGRYTARPDGETIAQLVMRAQRQHITQLWILPSAGRVEDLIPLADTWSLVASDHEHAKGGHWRHIWPLVAPDGGSRDALDVVFPADDLMAPWRDAHNARQLWHALTAYRELTGQPYYRSPGRTGRAIMEMSPMVRTLFQQRTPAGATPPTGTFADLGVSRVARIPAQGAYLHAYDKNGAYLAACSSLALGVGEPMRLVRPLRDVDAPGFYFVDGAWVSAPYWRYLRERSAPTPTEALIYPQHRRALETFYRALRDARARALAHIADLRANGMPDALEALELALRAIKATYSQGLSWLAGTWLKPGDPLYHPDWYYQVISQTTANLLREIDAVAAWDGMAPDAVDVDCLYFFSDDADPRRAAPSHLRFGDGLGQWKIKHAAIPRADLFAALGADGWPLGFGALRRAIDRVTADGRKEHGE